ncbi:MAG: phospho-sugar mutase [Streptococcaceae bacterium]|nr:phospho-sugar mutase [Streptococcaceae bacterium]
MDYKQNYNEWLNSDVFDEETKKELLAIKDDEAQIEDRFYKNLEFGTGGLRAVLGAGANRLNRYTVRRITSGYANYLLEHYGQVAIERGIVIAHDMRYGSREFTLEAARVFAAVGIPTYLFKEITTTPQLSFSVPYLKAVGGIVITASHNPPEYNGYKVYDETGGQAVPSLAEPIIEKIEQITDYSTIEVAPADSPLIHWLDETVDTAFIEAEKKNRINPQIVKDMGETMKVLYTPLHGTGKRAIFRVLDEVGFKNVFTVEEQLEEDPEFKTVKSPNPEELSAFDMALKVAKENDVDLIMGSDPDADRVGVLVKTGKNEYTPLNGNQIGSLLVYYLLSNDKELSSKQNPFIANTIVTSSLGGKIAESFGVKTVSTLTGFKFIGEQMNLLGGNHSFIMGYEESYGYLIGALARDKDAVGSAMMIAEMSAFYLNEGKTLVDQLAIIFEKYGYYHEKLVSQTLPGRDGMEQITQLMAKFRNLSAQELEVANIVEVKDYAKGIDGLPKSDVLKYFFKNGSWIAVRPSGTEPKIKYYLGVKAESKELIDTEIEKLEQFISM